MIYKCEKCQKTKQIVKATLKEVDGKIVTIEALCDCGEYMKVQVPKNQGMPTIIRNESTWEDDIIRTKAKQKEARLKKDGYDKNEWRG
jgi:formate dehydrogenase maturation protein FdhE